MRMGVSTTAPFSVAEWLIFKKRLLLRKREMCETQSRKLEMKEMILISSKQKNQPLENRRLFLPWQSDYSKLKKQFMKMCLPDWKSELLKLGKQSLRMRVDITPLRYFLTFQTVLTWGGGVGVTIFI